MFKTWIDNFDEKITPDLGFLIGIQIFLNVSYFVEVFVSRVKYE